MEEDVAFFVRQGIDWILSQCEAYHPHGEVLSLEEKEQLAPYFERETLETITRYEVSQIPQPPFLTTFERQKHGFTIDFSRMPGITFLDTILLASPKIYSEKQRISILFHECVHIVQYQLLGVEGFTESWITGWFQGREYFSIPLEQEAYSLQDAFEANQHHPFSVEQRLRQTYQTGSVHRDFGG